MSDELTQREKTNESLKRIQDFDPETLVRESALGNLNFSDVVEPARKIIGIFKRLPPSALDDFTNNQLAMIQGQADTAWNLFDQILKFDQTEQNKPRIVKDSLIEQVKSLCDSASESLQPLISYGFSRTQDFSHYEDKVNSLIQQFTDKGNGLVKQLEEGESNAQAILSNIRNFSGKQGVSWQATHFEDEAKKHEIAAYRWLGLTILVAAIAIMWALYIPHLSLEFIQGDENITLSAIQLVTSRILIFATLGYLLILCSKTYLSHKHNAVVNKHRQNALLTYTTLVKAASTDENADIILNHAANCIFSPQDSGYVSSGDKNINLPPINTIRRMSGGMEE